MSKGALEEILLELRTGGLKILVIVFGAFLLVRFLRAVVDRMVKLAKEGNAVLISEREKWAKTLAGILRAVGTITIVLIATMMVLRELGLDITPIVAGAGVAGLAIGFGAQSLIKDVIAGFFILLEDQFRVGDVIQAAGVSGLVEKMTLRITVIRDLHGTVHFIPNGEIKVVSNLTKEWSRAVLDIGVSYKEDIDRVAEVLRKVGSELQEDEQFGRLLLEPPEVLGVEAFGESKVKIKMVAKTLPQKQWEVARELRRRIKAAFDQEGIEIL